MKKGIVLEVHRDYITMMTPDGEFLKSKKQHDINYNIGEEVAFFPIQDVATRKKFGFPFSKLNIATAVSVLTAIILVLSIYPRTLTNQVHAYVSFDVNPSIEIAVNKDLKVLSLEGLNADGELIVEKLTNWKNEDLQKVSSNLLLLVKEEGYMVDGKTVLIASVLTDIDNLAFKSKMENEMIEITKEIQQEEVTVTILETNIEKRDIARQKGISVGSLVQQEQKTIAAENDVAEEEALEVEEVKGTTSEEENVEENSTYKETSKEEKPESQEEKREAQQERKQEKLNNHGQQQKQLRQQQNKERKIDRHSTKNQQNNGKQLKPKNNGKKETKGNNGKNGNKDNKGNNGKSNADNGNKGSNGNKKNN